MKQRTVTVFIICGMLIAGVWALIYSFGVTSTQPVMASALPDYRVPKVESRVVETRTIEYIDRPVIEVKQVGVPSKNTVTLRNFENLDAMKLWLAGYNDSTIVFIGPDSEVDCDDYAIALQQRALSDGYLVSFQIIGAVDYNRLFTTFKIPADALHALNLAIIGNDVYYIEPQTGETVIAARLD